ncbi:DUF3592 domain-containing protein [Actinocatenispora rupis]|uniref:DUF3592 domain-containing protein n=1 Tax=Actinocatenispora rupis TaxID=519421 RepID=A0A8J3JH80_9ACTN|nr:DUF3592 domain-containing protein [Actinocatenispora rupis]GID14868.1 hypothetical protein Aru02nite_57570 [Actinocatenispora rupis]
MLPLALFAVLLLAGVVLLVRQVILPAVQLIRLRRTGTRLSAQVIDNAPETLAPGKGAALRPVVRYLVDGRRHEGPLANLVSNQGLDVGRAIDVVIDPEAPSQPWAVEEGTWPLGAAWYPVMILVGLAGLWLSVARIR